MTDFDEGCGGVESPRDGEVDQITGMREDDMADDAFYEMAVEHYNMLDDECEELAFNEKAEALVQSDAVDNEARVKALGQPNVETEAGACDGGPSSAYGNACGAIEKHMAWMHGKDREDEHHRNDVARNNLVNTVVHYGGVIAKLEARIRVLENNMSVMFSENHGLRVMIGALNLELGVLKSTGLKKGLGAN